MRQRWAFGWLSLLFAAPEVAALAQNSEQLRAPSERTILPPVAGGKATIRCVVAQHRKLDNCIVVSEEPPGAGFGEMALRMSKEMRFDGPVGGTLTIPIAFKKPSSPPGP